MRNKGNKSTNSFSCYGKIWDYDLAKMTQDGFFFFFKLGFEIISNNLLSHNWWDFFFFCQAQMHETYYYHYKQFIINTIWCPVIFFSLNAFFGHTRISITHALISTTCFLKQTWFLFCSGWVLWNGFFRGLFWMRTVAQNRAVKPKQWVKRR